MIFPGQEGRETIYSWSQSSGRWLPRGLWVWKLQEFVGRHEGGGESDWSEGAAGPGGLSPCLSASGSEGLRETPHL